MKKSIAFALAALFVFTLGCSASTAENVTKDIADQFAGFQAADNEYVLRVKSSHHDEYPNISYGEAFDSFFATPTWKFFESEGGEKVVEFTGDCSFREVNVKARLQFIIATDEKTFDIGALSFNEVPQSNLITFSLLSAAFEEGVTQKDSSTATTTVPTTDSAKLTMKDTYDAIILDCGFTPGDAGEFPEDYYIIDIIGDFAPELVIGGDTTRNGRLTGAIYGYDTTVGEAFQYRGVTEIHNAEKGKDEYCIDWNWSYLGDYYTVYAPLGQYINEVKFFTVDHENGQYLIDDEVVSQTDFLADISKYLDPDEYDTELIYDEPEPSYGGTEVIMTTDELTNLNIFISNFLEAYFREYDPAYTSDSELVHFAYMHNWINYWERMEYAEGGGISYEGIDGSYISTIIKRFFNRDVSLYSFDSYIYQDGRLYSPAADGDPFSNFAQVYRVERDSTGALTVYFDEYQPFDVHDGPTQAMYKPVSTWSVALFGSAGETGRTGVARVQPVVLNGRATYQLEYLSAY